MKLKTKIFAITFLLGLFSFFFANFNSASADLVDDGKTLLLENYDVYGADAKFAEALALNPSDERANFWRALTIYLTNPLLKFALKDLGVFDASDKLIVLDKEDEFSINESIFDNIIIDNNDTTAGYSEEGAGWSTTAIEEAYVDDYRAHPAGAGSNKAIWNFTIPFAGEYEVSVWWPDSIANSTDAKFTVFYDGGSQTITKNQRTNGERWVNLGRFPFSPGADARVELSDDTTTGQVVADAAMLEFKSIFLDADTGHASFGGIWTDVVSSNAKNGSYKEIAAGTGGSCTWTVPITLSGKYHLYGRWEAYAGNATNAIFEIRKNGTLAAEIPVDQQHHNLDDVSLSLFEFQNADIITVTLLQNSSGKVTSDGIELVPVRTLPTLPEFQNIQTSTLTQIDQAIAYLNNVTSAFQDTADFHAVDDFGSPVITELDYGDALILKGFFNFYKSQFNCYATYDMDNLDAYEVGARYEGLLSANGLESEFPNFYKFSGDPFSRLATAKQAFINSINYYFDAYNSITAETDNQQDDFVTFDARYSQDAANYVHPPLNKVLANLNGSTSSFTIISDDLGFDQSDSYFNIRINLRAYFDNPTSLRSLLPQFNPDDTLVRSSAPDPTLGGILPDLGQEDFNGMAGLGACLSRPKISWDGDNFSVNLNWKVDTYSDFARYRIFRSTTDTVDETSLQVYDSTNKNTLTFTDTTVDSNQRTYYYRLYTYYSNGDKAVSSIRRVITKIYVDIGNTSGNEDGDKQHPFSNLGDAINDYGASGCKFIVAQGTYHESDTSLHMWNKSGILLEGGYESNNWARDIQVYETIIDATGRGGWNVVSFNNMASGGIDGFTIRGGSSLPSGSGINVWQSNNIKIANCKIENNKRGIGLYGSSGTIENCFITLNEQDGVNTNSSSVTIKQSFLQQNGTGMSLWGNSFFDVRDSQISGNTQRGVDANAYGTLFNNLITGNGYDGVRLSGADSLGLVTVENCTISGNAINNIYSAGFICYPSGGTFTPQVNNCIIANNSGYGVYAAGSVPVISYTDVYNNLTGNYAGSYTNGGGNISLNPQFAAGPSGNYYLSQTAAGQASNSPAVNTGSDTAVSLGLDDMATRSDEYGDAGTVDMGYHYSINDVSAALIKYVTPANYNVAENLTTSDQYYMDRAYTLASVPSELIASTWIKTRNNDKANTSASFLTFTLTRGAVVYVAYDSRATSLPTWLSGFTNTGLTLGTTDVTLKIYAKFYAAGPVTLGGNLAAGAVGAATNYIVAAKEGEALALVEYVTPTNYNVAENLNTGDQYYMDRAYTLTSVPAELSVSTWIKTRNNDKANTSASFLTFTLTRDAVVYVAYDSRATSLPTWLSGFTNTGLTLGTTDVTLKIYAKFYAAGPVTLGGNLAAGAVGAATNYIVAAKEGESLALIKYVTPANYNVAENLNTGDQYYMDRAYTLTSVPSELSVSTWIKTRNNDKANTSESFLTFTLTRGAVVYVAYDSRATSLPTWLSGFTNTGLTLGTTDVTLKIYAKFYAAGPVTLGGNMAAGAVGAATNYIVAAKEGESLALIKYVTPANYDVAENLTTGNQYYMDRAYTLASVPLGLSVSTWIKTRNNDKANTSESFLTFTLTRGAVVYVAYDSRATSLPAWLSGFTNTGLTLGTTDVTLKIYAKFYAAGPVTLGGNMAAGAVGANTNYIVIAKE